MAHSKVLPVLDVVLHLKHCSDFLPSLGSRRSAHADDAAEGGRRNGEGSEDGVNGDHDD